MADVTTFAPTKQSDGTLMAVGSSASAKLALTKADYKYLVDSLSTMTWWIWPSAEDLQRRYDSMRGTKCSSCGAEFVTWQRSCSSCGRPRELMRDTVEMGADGTYERVKRDTRSMSVRQATQRTRGYPVDLCVAEFLLKILERQPTFLSSGREMLKRRLGEVLTERVPPEGFAQMQFLTKAEATLVDRWKAEKDEAEKRGVDLADEREHRLLVHRLLDATLETLGVSEVQRKIGRRYLRAPTEKEKLRALQHQAFWVWAYESCTFGAGQVDLHTAMVTFETWLADRCPEVGRVSPKLFSKLMVTQPGVGRRNSSHDHRVVFVGIAMNAAVAA